MGFNFRKSIKILPGVKLNISKKGMSSVSVGGKGATLNVRKDGNVKGTVGIPGSGMSYTETLSTGKRDNDHRAPLLDWSIFTGTLGFIGAIIAACIFFYYLFS